MDSRKIDRLIQIKGEIDILKKEQSQLESEFILQGQKDLENTKYKTATYTSSSGNKIVATTARTVKLTYPTYLRQIFGMAYADAVTEKTTYKLSDPASRMLGGLWNGEYIKGSLSGTISQLPCEDAAKRVLVKKLHGVNYDNDVRVLQTIGKLPEPEAQEWAYLIQEAVVWEDFARLLNSNGLNLDEDAGTIMNMISGAIVVEENTKIMTVESSL